MKKLRLILLALVLALVLVFTLGLAAPIVVEIYMEKKRKSIL